MFDKQKTVLVAGGAGFIGSHLIEALLKRGDEVICIDNLLSGTPENIVAFTDNPSFRFIEHDITKDFSVDCDEIYNLACPASPKFYALDPLKTLTTCFEGSLNMLRLAEINNAKILFTSTSEIYGDPEITPQPENYNGSVDTFCPRSCYDEGKRVAETLCATFMRRGVDVRVCRLFNVYGPRMRSDDGRVIPCFIKQAFNGKAFTINGNGSQTRSFCYIDDMIRAIIALMEVQKIYRPINLGNPEEITINKLAFLIRKFMGVSCDFVYQTLPDGDPKRRKPDITKAKQLLNWEPTISLEEGLKKTIEFFRFN